MLCGLRTSDPAITKVGLGGLLPQVPDESLVGLPFIDDGFRDFRRHGPRIRIGNLPGVYEGSAARVTSFVFTANSQLDGAKAAAPFSVPPQPKVQLISAIFPSGLNSTRTRGRSVAAAGNPAVNGGFDARASERTRVTPMSLPRRRPASPLTSSFTAASSCRGPTPLRTVPIPFFVRHGRFPFHRSHRCNNA